MPYADVHARDGLKPTEEEEILYFRPEVRYWRPATEVNGGAVNTVPNVCACGKCKRERKIHIVLI